MKRRAGSKWVQYSVLLLLAAATVYALLQLKEVPKEKAELGKQAPAFSLDSLQGGAIALSDYRGKGVALNFWASWCNPCVNELPLLNEAYRLTGVNLIAVNVGESEETAQKFAERYDLSFPIVFDRELTVKTQYRVVGLPLTVLIDADGVLVERHEGELTDMADILQLLGKITNE